MGNKDIGEYIRRERNKRKISVRQLALQSGISASYISRLENGKTKNVIKPITIKKLAKGLRIDEDQLLKQFNFQGYNNQFDSKVINLPLIKNPLVDSNVDSHENLIKYLPFLKMQISESGKYVVKYKKDDMKEKVPVNSFIVLNDLGELNNNQLVGFFEKSEFKLGYIKLLEDKVILINDNIEIINFNTKDIMKKRIWKVTLIFKEYDY